MTNIAFLQETELNINLQNTHFLEIHVIIKFIFNNLRTLALSMITINKMLYLLNQGAIVQKRRKT